MLYYPQPLGTSMKDMSVEEINRMLADIRKMRKYDRNAATDALEAALIHALLVKKNKKNSWMKRKVKNAQV